MSKITRNGRTAALVGAAIIAGSVSLPLAYDAFAAPADVGTLPASSGSFAPIVDADKPAVVTITTTLKAADVSDEGDGAMDEQFKQFFEQKGITVPGQGTQRRPTEHGHALGSGFIISADGVIVTNNHVIENATDIKVTLDDGTELPAKLLGADAKSDLAVLKVTTKKQLTTLSWGNSEKLKLGDQILAIGNPFGIGTTVTAGIVSARGRDLHSGPYDNFIQIDAPINHGNSGGPLVDRDGNVVGINSAIYSPNGGSVGVGFAIPSEEAKAIVAKLQTNGSIDHGYLGVQIQPVTQDVADAIGLANAQGALVTAVTDGSAAAEAGLKAGDVVTGVGSGVVKTSKDLSRLVADLSPGAKETMSIVRDGKSMDLSVTIGANEDGKLQAAADTSDGETKQTGPSIGVTLSDLTAEAKEQLKLPEDAAGAVVAKVNPDKTAAAVGIQIGDVIVSVNGQPVRDAKAVKIAVAGAAKSGKKSVLLLVERGEHKTFLAVPFSAA
ncbi:Do family serine endopeptidase [Rhizobium tubonense]|uniref:Probable periplasmic serine endoprotease DegP-like n=1 Tax=Rhizobium tubonense TaxID=484088 RepID=A0A2W4DVC9_9HYPH|nr:Do family serine endopeptidase [Rhizobium tubonense]PZM07986.1 serine protease [Rhizobium tubonense]